MKRQPKVGVHGVIKIGYEEPLEHGSYPVVFDYACSPTYRGFEHYQNTGELHYNETIPEKSEPPKVIPNHILQRQINELKGITNYTKTKLQQLTLKRKGVPFEKKDWV